jgi:thiol-disulfide isomerase/thioredoxin
MNLVLKSITLIILLYFAATGLFGQNPVIFDKYEDFAKSKIRHNDTTYVINFWASWCKPCVKELPFFETFNKTVSDKKIKVILVSLDFKNEIQSKLIPFIRKYKYATEIVVLTDKNYNAWLPSVDTDWEGSIPATLLVSGLKQKFVEREFENQKELSDFVLSFISSL